MKKRQLTLVDYLLVSMVHLIPIEILFAFLAHTFPLWESSLVFIDIMYFIIVGIVGIIHNRKKVMKAIIDAVTNHFYREFGMGPVDIKPIVQSAKDLGPYIDALKKNREKLTFTPDEFIALLSKIKDMADGPGREAGPGTVVTAEKSSADVQKELSGPPDPHV